jgi:hypothetical protein
MNLTALACYFLAFTVAAAIVLKALHMFGVVT